MPTKLIGKSEYLETGSITPRKNVDMNNGAFASVVHIYMESFQDSANVMSL